MEIHESFLSDGFVSVNSDYAQSIKSYEIPEFLNPLF